MLHIVMAVLLSTFLHSLTESHDEHRCLQMGEDPAGLPLNLVCFDEIDALCRRRGSLSGDTSGVRDSVVNQVNINRLHLALSTNAESPRLSFWLPLKDFPQKPVRINVPLPISNTMYGLKCHTVHAVCRF